MQPVRSMCCCSGRGTPGYLQKDLDLRGFQGSLQEYARIRDRSGPLAVGMHDQEMEVKNPAIGMLLHDGNNRSMEMLQSDMAKNGLMHNMLIELLRKQYSQMEMALNIQEKEKEMELRDQAQVEQDKRKKAKLLKQADYFQANADKYSKESKKLFTDTQENIKDVKFMKTDFAALKDRIRIKPDSEPVASVNNSQTQKTQLDVKGIDPPPVASVSKPVANVEAKTNRVGASGEKSTDGATSSTPGIFS